MDNKISLKYIHDLHFSREMVLYEGKFWMDRERDGI